MENMGFIIIIIIASIISTVIKTVRSRTATPPPQKPNAVPKETPLPIDLASAVDAWMNQDKENAAPKIHGAKDAPALAPAADQWQQRVDEKRQQSKDERAAEDASVPVRTAVQPGMTLSFSAQNVINGVIMHEILTRPRSATRRMPCAPCQRTRT